MLSAVRIVLEASALLLSLALITIAWTTTRRLARLDEAHLSTAMFLHADLVRRSLLVFAIAVALFVAMPVSILAYLVTDQDVFEVVHDASHVVFLGLILAAAFQWGRLAKNR